MGRREHVPRMGYEQPRREGPCMKEDLRMCTTNEKKKKENVTEGWGKNVKGQGIVFTWRRGKEETGDIYCVLCVHTR